MRFVLFRWLATTVAILVVPYLISGVHVSGLGAALVTAAVLGALNIMIRPVLIFLTFPLTILSLGLFLLVINAFLFELAARVVPGISVDSFGSAFLAALLVSFISWLVQAPGRGRFVVVRRGMTGGDGAWPPRTSRRDDSTIELDRDEDGKWR